jgi:UDP-N-acetylglucosamine 2-epimerase (non-hydrolysing)
MKKIKSLTVIGTRPEAIKMAILIKELDKTDFIINRLCLTGQHREMLDQVLEYFNLKSDYDLNIMKKNQSLEHITSRIIVGLRKILLDFKPDIVFVHGDTTTCFASALASFYQNIKVCHVEAGLRTNNIHRPFPEELNRNLVSKMAFLNFAPTEKNKNSLVKENINQNKIFVTGNTVIDSLLWTINRTKYFSSSGFESIKKLCSSDKKIILLTAHRRENIGEGIKSICESVLNLADKFDDISFVLPVHPNPNISGIFRKKLSNHNKIILIEPMSYPDFVLLIKNSWLILTDSGGLQEEAPSLGVPVLVLRTETERKEAIDAGTVKLIGTEKKMIIKNVEKLYNNHEYYKKMSNAVNPYGDGNSVGRILEILKEFHSMLIK